MIIRKGAHCFYDAAFGRNGVAFWTYLRHIIEMEKIKDFPGGGAPRGTVLYIPFSSRTCRFGETGRTQLPCPHAEKPAITPVPVIAYA
jgi:hypothetical protein